MADVTFKIDGKEITAAGDKTIYQIAEENGIQIPTLCHNSQVSHTTSCFVCVVKDKKRGKFLPSCSSYPSEGMELESDTEEVQEMRRTALELLFSEHKGDCEAPCTIACPAHAKVEEYVRAGKNGDFLECLKILKQRIPLPLSIGRVCPRFCEKECRRNISGEPVAINDFKRLAGDLYYEEYMEDLPSLQGKKVAIIGSGPAGLSAAYFLRLEGIKPVILERMNEGGGMLRYGIPEYRLPKDILDKELAHFEKMGIDIQYGQEAGIDFSLADLKKEYDAVVIAIGCWRCSSMRCEGEDLAEGGISWLEEIAQAGWQGDNPGKTVVIGGGNTAMDCVRTAVRLGSEDVSCYYRRTEKEMPAEEIEIKEAKEEGVNFEFLTSPTQLRKESGKLILTCQRMKLGEPDASGRRRPLPIEGSEYDVEADTVIAAIGQKTKATDDMKTNKWGDVDVSRATLQMEEKVFAAGDCVSGPATVVEAVAAGRKVALSIADYLAGKEHQEPYLLNVSRGHWSSLKPEDIVFLKTPSASARVKLKHLDIEKRKNTFGEVTETCTAEQMQEEGARCYECSCTAKHDCQLKEHGETYQADPEAILGEKLALAYDNNHPSIIHDRQKCIKCGICIKICREVIDKNLLAYKNRGFNAQVGTAFNETLPESCSECGACIEECPVGALDWKDKEKDK